MAAAAFPGGWTGWKAGPWSLGILVFSNSELPQHLRTVRHRLPEMAQA